MKSNWSYSPKTPNLGQNRWFFVCPVWPWNLTADTEKEYGTSSILHQALYIISKPWVNSNWSYSPETRNSGQNRRFSVSCDIEIWWVTLENNRAPLLSNIKLFILFNHHMLIQIEVTVRKRLSWVSTSVTLTFDIWPWPFAWTSLLTFTPDNFMMIRWGEHSQKGVTDRQTYRRTDRRTDGRTEPFIERLGRS